jgi:hypothetical protein
VVELIEFRLRLQRLPDPSGDELLKGPGCRGNSPPRRARRRTPPRRARGTAALPRAAAATRGGGHRRVVFEGTHRADIYR